MKNRIQFGLLNLSGNLLNGLLPHRVNNYILMDMPDENLVTMQDSVASSLYVRKSHPAHSAKSSSAVNNQLIYFLTQGNVGQPLAMPSVYHSGATRKQPTPGGSLFGESFDTNIWVTAGIQLQVHITFNVFSAIILPFVISHNKLILGNH